MCYFYSPTFVYLFLFSKKKAEVASDIPKIKTTPQDNELLIENRLFINDLFFKKKKKFLQNYKEITIYSNDFNKIYINIDLSKQKI